MKTIFERVQDKAYNKNTREKLRLAKMEAYIKAKKDRSGKIVYDHEFRDMTKKDTKMHTCVIEQVWKDEQKH